MEKNKDEKQEQDENNLHSNHDVSGNDMTEEGRERKHHQQFGNRHYESNRNHSSNDDQPLTDTSPTGSSPTIT